MKKYVSLFLLFLFSVCAPTSAQNPAGIALYFEETRSTCFLQITGNGQEAGRHMVAELTRVRPRLKRQLEKLKKRPVAISPAPTC